MGCIGLTGGLCSPRIEFATIGYYGTCEGVNA